MMIAIVCLKDSKFGQLSQVAPQLIFLSLSTLLLLFKLITFLNSKLNNKILNWAPFMFGFILENLFIKLKGFTKMTHWFI